MADVKGKSQGTQPPPPVSDGGHPMPRIATPEKSVTLRHHRLARDASMRPEPVSNPDLGSSPRRNSSGDSHETGQSDPKNWFDRSNRNHPAAYDYASMDGMCISPSHLFCPHLISFQSIHPFSRNSPTRPTENPTHVRELRTNTLPPGIHSHSSSGPRSPRTAAAPMTFEV